jgi:hypothetical protein
MQLPYLSRQPAAYVDGPPVTLFPRRSAASLRTTWLLYQSFMACGPRNLMKISSRYNPNSPERRGRYHSGLS